MPQELLRKYKYLILIICGIVFISYASSLYKAWTKPWALWKHEWQELMIDVPEQERLERYATREDCIRNQWVKLDEMLKLLSKVGKLSSEKLSKFQNVYFEQGRTIFGFQRSIYSRSKKIREGFIKRLAGRKDLTAKQREGLTRKVMLPDLSHSITYFCAPTRSTSYWPYYNPTGNPATGDLKRLGERTLAVRADKIFLEQRK